MSSKDQNLSSLPELKHKLPERLKIGIVRAEWNEEVTAALLQGCLDALEHYGLQEHQIVSVEVPGSFELPAAAKMLIGAETLDAVICLGCVIKGETSHNEYINQAVAHGLVKLGLNTGVPCIFGVLTPDNMEQARERAGGKHGNKGAEAAYSALSMVGLRKSLRDKKQKIGY